jgi:hypothetical protein
MHFIEINIPSLPLVQATDVDSDNFGRVQYAIGQSSQFSVGQDTGLLGLSQYNPETDPKFAEFSVNATDNFGVSPSFMSTALVKVSGTATGKACTWGNS